MPVGVGVPTGEVTVTVKVTGWPKADGLADDVNVVLVFARVTCWVRIGVVLPSGKLTAAQMAGLAQIAATLGDGDIRLTVWQNLLLSSIADEMIAEAVAAIAALGLVLILLIMPETRRKA